MELSVWLIYSGFALVSILSPGPAVLLAVTNSIQKGFVQSLFSSLGNIIGIFLVSTGAAVGLGALLQTSVVLFRLLKIAGALYLIFLGIRQWRSREKLFRDSDGLPGSPGEAGSNGFIREFITGLLVALSNPKAVLFFTALFPQFLDVSKPLAGQFMILTTTFMALSFTVLALYAKGARSFKRWLSAGQRAQWFNRVCGTIFIGMGLGILKLKHRTA